MTLEKQLEDNLLSALSSDALSAWQFVTSRQSSQEDYFEDDDKLGVIAIKVSYRQHDNFSLSPVSIPVAVSINTRIELDPDSTSHEDAVQEITDKLADWHRFPKNMDIVLNNSEDNLYYAGELRISGGTGRVLDKQMGIFSDAIDFIIRGAERFVYPSNYYTYVKYDPSLDPQIPDWKGYLSGTLDLSSIPNVQDAVDMEIGSRINSLGVQAFYNCSKLSSVTIPDTVLSVKQRAFSRCYGLSSLEIPESVDTILQGAFEFCSALTSIQLPSHIDTFQDAMFIGCTNLCDIELPDGIVELGDSTFANCQSLSSVTFPSTMTKINGYVFSGCKSLSSLTIPNNVTLIISHAFYNTTRLMNVTMEGKTTHQVTTMSNYPWDLRNGCVIHCINGDITI